MHAIEFSEALALSRHNAFKRFPDRADARQHQGLVFPHLVPRFTFRLPATVFTIGSCFARHVEEALQRLPIRLPTRQWSAPPSEWPHRPNGLLNEYNPGSIAQRIADAALGRPAAPGTLRPAGPDGCIDLLLPGGPRVDAARAAARRDEIDTVYRQLPASDLLIVTLGLVEAWYDTGSGVCLSRMPAPDERRQRGRYELRVLDLAASLALLEPALRTLFARAPALRAVVTVSPVPLQTTFTAHDAVLANALSKSTLRLVAQRLTERLPQVDYFPSYEIVTSGGPAAFAADNVHVRDEAVQAVTTRMVSLYFPTDG